MRFPSYEHYDRPSLNVIDGYINYVGRRFAQQPHEAASNAVLERAAVLLARGCMQQAVEVNPYKAKKTLLEAQRCLPFAEQEEGVRSLSLAAIIRAVAFRNNSSVLKESREALHGATIRNLRAQMSKAAVFQNRAESSKSGEFGLIKGHVNEQATLGIFSRLGAHPWFGAWPALQFQDEGKDTRNNIDVVAAEATTNLELPNTYALQVKSTCQSFCANPKSAISYRGYYSPEVILVSGECDLSIPATNGEPAFSTAQMLIDEYDNKLPLADVQTLDQLGNELMLAITTQSKRRGTLIAQEG